MTKSKMTAIGMAVGHAILLASTASQAATKGPTVIATAGNYTGSYVSSDAATPAIVITATSGAVVFSNCSASNTHVSGAAPTVLIKPAGTVQSTATVTFNNCKISNASTAASTAQTAAAVQITPLAGPVSITGAPSWLNTNPCVLSSASALSSTVLVQTSSIVTIQKCTITGKYDLIDSFGYGPTNLNIIENKATGVNPGLASQSQGRFVHLLAPDALTVSGNYLENTAGIYVNGYGETGHVVGDNIVITKNSAKNINGRYSNGAGGYSTASQAVQFVQFDKVLSNPGKSIQVSWNQVINQPGQSAVEDNINIGSSSGTANYPITIRNNFIRGGYPADLNAGQTGYSGGGIITDTAPNGLITNYVLIDSNQVVDTVNYGIAISDGYNIKITNNRLVGENKLPNGTVIWPANVGIYIANNWARDPVVFRTSNSVGCNVTGWMAWSHETPPVLQRNDYYFPPASTDPNDHLLPFAVPNCSTTNSANTSIIPAGGNPYTALPSGLSDAEQTSWTKKLSANGIKVGPSW